MKEPHQSLGLGQAPDYNGGAFSPANVAPRIHLLCPPIWDPVQAREYMLLFKCPDTSSSSFSSRRASWPGLDRRGVCVWGGDIYLQIHS